MFIVRVACVGSEFIECLGITKRKIQLFQRPSSKTCSARILHFLSPVLDFSWCFNINACVPTCAHVLCTYVERPDARPLGWVSPCVEGFSWCRFQIPENSFICSLRRSPSLAFAWGESGFSGLLASGTFWSVIDLYLTTCWKAFLCFTFTCDAWPTARRNSTF